MIDVALARCLVLPEPDPDAEILLAALGAAGVEAAWLPWDDPDLSWRSKARLVLLRSTWNYYEDLERFIAWAEAVARESTLQNPLEVVRWNVHKRYLAELRRRGVASVPTEYVPAASEGEARPRLAEVMDARGWRRVVVKPEVSAASANTHLLSRDEVDEALWESLLAKRDMMVQPYLESVEGHGERAVVWIDGAITHAVRKSPRFGGQDESVSDAVAVSDDEEALALAALETVGVDLLYGRVDVARDDDGTPMVMELELVEPSLFLAQSGPALERFVEAIRGRLHGSR